MAPPPRERPRDASSPLTPPLPEIALIPLDAGTLDALAAELRRDVARQTRAFAERANALAPWGGYLALDPGTRTVIGTCAFKGPPDAEGAVEIAYFTFPANEGRGYATAMAEALRRRASPARVVRAHTSPERNASVRVLEKLGFRHLGEVIDPEDGPVWRWEWNPG